MGPIRTSRCIRSSAFSATIRTAPSRNSRSYLLRISGIAIPYSRCLHDLGEPHRAMRRWSSIRPPARPRGQRRPGPGHIVVLLGPQPGRAPGWAHRQVRLRQTSRTGRPAEARHVHQHHVPAAMAGGDHSATTAARHRRDRLNHDPESVAVPVDPDDVEAVQPDQQMTPVAVAGGVGPVAAVRTRARSSARRRLGQLEAFRSVSLVATDAGRPRPASAATHARVSISAPTSSQKSPLCGRRSDARTAN